MLIRNVVERCRDNSQLCISIVLPVVNHAWIDNIDPLSNTVTIIVQR